MKRGSTVILRAIIVVGGLGVLVLCFLSLLKFIDGQVGGYAPILIGVYVSLVPFLFALIQGMKLLGNIDQDKAFSVASVSALKNIKISATVIGAMYTLGIPYVYIVADRDDAPGVIVMALGVILISFVVAIFSSVIQRLFQNAVDIKSENDLTV